MYDLSPGITMRSTIPAYSYRHGLNFIPGIVKTRIDCYSGISNSSLIVMAPGLLGYIYVPNLKTQNLANENTESPCIMLNVLHPFGNVARACCLRKIRATPVPLRPVPGVESIYAGHECVWCQMTPIIITVRYNYNLGPITI